MKRRTKQSPSKTSAFGQASRIQHDSSSFYAQFESVELSDDDQIKRSPIRNLISVGDARNLEDVPDNSVALVVTSPPYFAAKEYELGYEGLPNLSFSDYLEVLRESLNECYRVLEPGGRIALNVANIGRKPYRSLSSRLSLMMESCGFLMRGEVVWIKAKGSSTSLAWGSFASASNPVLRDVTERVLIGCKGRFDRAISKSRRAELGLPNVDSISKENFLQWTLDTWHIPPEHARRVGHPAPFPVELPRRLIELYTYQGDLVLDPFVGSGSTCLAAAEVGRDYLGFDLDANYVTLANERISQIMPRLPGM